MASYNYIPTKNGGWMKNMKIGDKFIEDFSSFVLSKGFSFPKRLIRRYLTCLMTKPFVILSGISGTGKTKLAQLFTEFMTNNDQQKAFIPVRPDWNDNKGLFGFYNIITESYHKTPFLNILLEATQNPQELYFVILDEMNLAKVEYYFSDFLSAFESRIIDNQGILSQEAIFLHDSIELPINGVPHQVCIPRNLFITGTVNIDETTYMFSPKVLDRASVIEFEEVDLEKYFAINDQGMETAAVKPDSEIISFFTNNGNFLKKGFSNINNEFKTAITEIFNVLHKYRKHFGYRVLNEIFCYSDIQNNFTCTKAEIIDEILLQKIMPKIYGSEEIKPLLIELDKTINTLSDKPMISSQLISRMLNDLENKGFTSAIF